MQQTSLESTAVAGFAGAWRRVAAFAIDAVALVAIGQLLGVVLGDAFASAGAWARLIGFALALAWFVPFESAWGGACTPGKRLLGLRVARLDGTPPGAARAAARCAILLLPFFLNGAPLPATLLFGGGVFVVSLLVFGVGLVSLYLFIFGRRTHRALHDRLTATAVLCAEADRAHVPVVPPLLGRQRAVIGALLALSAVVPLAMRQLVRTGPLADIAQLYAAVAAQPDVRYAGVGETAGGPGAGHAQVVSVDAVVDRPLARPGDLPEKLAAIVFASFPGAASAGRIRIELRRGFDIGIASRFEDRVFDRTPLEWRERIVSGAGD